MDTAVQWVKAYLEANGYFTIAEYQVIEAIADGEFKTTTDLDIMAVRFPGAGRLVPRVGRAGERFVTTDPLLDVSEEKIDLIIGEVKEGAAELNRTAKDPRVLRAALARFGAVAYDEAPSLVDELVRSGEATSPIGFRVRLAAFGTRAPRAPKPRHMVVGLGHVGKFLETLVAENWDALSTAHFSDPVYGSLALMEKARRAGEIS